MSDTPKTDAVCTRNGQLVTPEEMRRWAEINRNDFEVGAGIADGQLQHADLIELCRTLERDAEELANALRDVLAGHPVLNADELINRYSPLGDSPRRRTEP